ncbi:MAG TPA: hypothetical protein VJM33_02730 [Microthrixaceae bacterium]|nr:hypothetical protein [Microthrixaceae bacterium]
MNRSRRALIGALVLMVATVAACVPPPSGGGGAPLPVFPAPGCYELINDVDIAIVGPIDTVENAELRASIGRTCSAPWPDDSQQFTFVAAGTGGEALAKCKTLEPGSMSVAQSSAFIVQGTTDVWMCEGGVAPGDCADSRDAGDGDVEYLGPIDTLDNALLYTSEDRSCTGASSPITVVVASTPVLAVPKCQALRGPSSLALQGVLEGYQVSVELFLCT